MNTRDVAMAIVLETGAPRNHAVCVVAIFSPNPIQVVEAGAKNESGNPIPGTTVTLMIDRTAERVRFSVVAIF